MLSIVSNFRSMVSHYEKRGILTMLGFFFQGLKVIFYFPGQLRLDKVLNPLYKNGFVRIKIYYLYLFKSLSFSLSTHEKLRITICHHTFLRSHFPYEVLLQIFGEGLKCWNETVDGNVYEVTLSGSFPFEEEGFLSLALRMNGKIIYIMGLSFAPGEYFGLLDEHIVYVSRIQGAGGNLTAISKCAKNFKDNSPPTLMISTLEGFALALGIKSLIGISAHNQILYDPHKINFFKSYDSFWKTFASIKIPSGDYYLSLPIKNKEISLIKQHHRKRTLTKRKVRHNISGRVYRYLINYVFIKASK